MDIVLLWFGKGTHEKDWAECLCRSICFSFLKEILKHLYQFFERDTLSSLFEMQLVTG